MKKTPDKTPETPEQAVSEHAMLSDIALNTISDGVVILNQRLQIILMNPAAVTMLGYVPEGIMGLDVRVIFKFENGQGMPIEEKTSPFLRALMNNTPFSSRDLVLINGQGQKRPIAITITHADSHEGEKILTFRDISAELEREGAQTEFISTASHEMRTPVASIEGYLGLALNPSCATIDDRARKYLEQAHSSSQHLGRLFRDLLDVTKLDDKKLHIHPIPIEIVSTVRKIVEGQIPTFAEKHLHYTFGSNSNMGDSAGGRMMAQEVYASVDVDFLEEIINNLIENAVKYNNEGGGIWVNVRGDGDRVLINVTDTGIGISPDDLKHIFQKFYRADNSQTRTIGGTGLGLYLVRERVEAMSGKVWAESSFGEGTTFYISLPRLTLEEYERRRALLSVQQPELAILPQSDESPAPAQATPSAAPAPVQPAAPAQTAPSTAPAQTVPSAAPAQTPQSAAPAQPAAPVQTAQPASPQPTAPAQPPQSATEQPPSPPSPTITPPLRT